MSETPEQELERLRFRLSEVMYHRDNLQTALNILVDRGVVPIEEFVQMGLIRATRDQHNELHPVKMDMTDLRDQLHQADHKQATVAKFRNLKQAFLQYQKGTAIILNDLDKLCRANHVTPHDIRMLRDIRDQVSDLIGREL